MLWIGGEPGAGQKGSAAALNPATQLIACCRSRRRGAAVPPLLVSTQGSSGELPSTKPTTSAAPNARLPPRSAHRFPNRIAHGRSDRSRPRKARRPIPHAALHRHLTPGAPRRPPSRPQAAPPTPRLLRADPADPPRVEDVMRENPVLHRARPPAELPGWAHTSAPVNGNRSQRTAGTPARASACDSAGREPRRSVGAHRV